jgi:hypothetical protein
MANGAAALASSVGLVETLAGTVGWRPEAHFQTCGGLDPDFEIGFAGFLGYHCRVAQSLGAFLSKPIVRRSSSARVSSTSSATRGLSIVPRQGQRSVAHRHGAFETVFRQETPSLLSRMHAWGASFQARCGRPGQPECFQMPSMTESRQPPATRLCESTSCPESTSTFTRRWSFYPLCSFAKHSMFWRDLTNRRPGQHTGCWPPLRPQLNTGNLRQPSNSGAGRQSWPALQRFRNPQRIAQAPPLSVRPFQFQPRSVLSLNLRSGRLGASETQLLLLEQVPLTLNIIRVSVKTVTPSDDRDSHSPAATGPEIARSCERSGIEVITNRP